MELRKAPVAPGRQQKLANHRIWRAPWSELLLLHVAKALEVVLAWLDGRQH